MQTESFQQRFHADWAGLSDPHVRALAWLITAPNLLDPAALRWQDKIATLVPADDVVSWLYGLDQEPAALHTYLRLGPFERLGRYAEKLLAFYFQYRDCLVAHGLQVQGDAGQTLGEFDFFLRQDQGLVHWEFATKLYLMQAPERDGDACFIGPNLVDTLQIKMDKILNRQLALGQHPDAAVYLPEKLIKAEALIKGWMFYRDDDTATVEAGLTAQHCRGFWCTHSEASNLAPSNYVFLPRLSWLAPVQLPLGITLNKGELLTKLHAHFLLDKAPVLIAQCQGEGEYAHETMRGFIVPDDWRQRAGQRAQRAVIRPG